MTSLLRHLHIHTYFIHVNCPYPSLPSSVCRIEKVLAKLERCWLSCHPTTGWPMLLPQVSLLQLFDSSDYKFDIPTYQRPYAWRTKQIYELIQVGVLESRALGSKESRSPSILQILLSISVHWQRSIYHIYRS